MAPKKKTRRERLEYLVVQHNDIVQKAQHSLTEQQQNILLHMVAQIGMEDEPNTVYQFSIKEFCEDFNLNTDTGYYHKTIIEDIHIIDSQEMIMIDSKNPDRKTRLRWLDVLRWDDGAGVVEYSFNNDIRPYLFELEGHFNGFRKKYGAALTGRYSKKLFAVLKSYEFMERVIRLDLDYLRIILDAETYPRYVDFKRFVLEPSIKQINDYTDIKVNWEVGKMAGRAVKAIDFYIYDANDMCMDEIRARAKRLEEKLDL